MWLLLLLATRARQAFETVCNAVPQPRISVTIEPGSVDGGPVRLSVATLVLTACTVDLETGKVDRPDSGGRACLTELELRLLTYLADRRGEVVATARLLTDVWGFADGVITRTVAANVGRLRAKIERDPSAPDHLVTLRGQGYRFDPPSTAAAAPVARDRFFGRTRERALLEHGLQHRLVSLVGPGGIGKTRLARQVGATLWCACTEDTDEDSLTRRVATSLSVAAGRSGQVLVEDVGSALAARGATTLVLDNLEQVLDAAAPLIVQWLDMAPELTILTTTREPLRLSGEQVIELGPLDTESGVALFLDRARVGGSVGLDRIIDRLEGHPLAIELAAGWARVLSLDELLDRLSTPLDLLVSDERDRDPRHQTLTAVLQTSWGLLSDDERAGLERLATTRGPFSMSDAEALGVAPSTARALRSKSLLEGQLRISEAVRSFGERQARDRGTWQDATRAHRRWLIGRASAFDPAGNPPTAADLRWAGARLDDLRSAWRQALEDAPAAAAQLAVPLHDLYFMSGPVDACLEILTPTIDRMPVSSLLGHLLRYRAQAAHMCAQPALARADLDAALSLASDLADPVLEGRCHTALTVMALDRSDFGAAEAHNTVAQAALQRGGDEAGLATCLANQATACWFTGRLDEALALYQQAIELHRRHGNHRSATAASCHRAMVQTELGNDAEGHRTLEQALTVLRGHDDRLHEASTLVHLGRLHNKCGRYDQGLACLAEATTLYRHYAGRRARLAEALLHQGIALQLQGAFADALPYFDEAIAVWDRAGRPHRIADLERMLLLAQLGDADAVYRALQGWEPHTQREQRFVPLIRGSVRAVLGQDPTAELIEAREAIRGELLYSEAWLYLAQLERAAAG